MTHRRAPAALLAGATIVAVVATAIAPVRAAATWAQAKPLPGLAAGRIWAVTASPATAGFAAAATDSGVYVTLDSGVHWSTTALQGVRVWSLGFDPRDPTRMFAGTDGSGIKLTTNGGASWVDASAGLQDRTIRSLAFGLDGVAAGTNKGVALSPDGVSWHDGGLDRFSISSVVVAANTPTLQLIAATDRGDLSGGYLFRYSGSGVAWTAAQSGLPTSAVVSAIAVGPLSTAVSKRPLVVATSKGAFRSGDSGSTWTAATGVPETLTLTTASFSPLDPNLVYAGADAGGSNGGDLLRSVDGGSTFSVADQGLPDKIRQVESIAVLQTTPPGLIAALDPAAGGTVFTEVDATAPAPPTLVAEAPGAPVPATLATPVPTPRPSVSATASPTPSASGPSGFVGTVLHFPMPLVLEVLLVLAIVYLVVRWRQRYYVEGPP